MNNLVMRKAAMTDVKGIHSLLLAAASEGQLLPRPLSELYGHIREFYILLEEGVEGAPHTVYGCCALSIVWEDMAEIRSLIVRPETRRAGWGKKLVEACVAEAHEFGISKLFTLTYQVGFFEKLGFAVISKDILPQKIWSVCINCPKFPDCDEVAMLKAL